MNIPNDFLRKVIYASSRILAKRRFSYVLALLVIGLSPSSATTQTSEEVRLPGHLKNNSEALKNSSVVVIGILASKGALDPGPPAVIFYFHNKLIVEDKLMGSIENEVDCAFSYIDYPKATAESVPTIGKRYIVFLQPGNTRLGQAAYTALKFSECDEEKLNKLKKLINELK